MASDGEFEDDFYDTPAPSSPAIPTTTLPTPIPSNDQPVNELPPTKGPNHSNPSLYSPLTISKVQVESASHPPTTSESSAVSESQHASISVAAETCIETPSLGSEDTVQQEKAIPEDIKAVKTDSREIEQKVGQQDNNDIKAGAPSNRNKPDPEFLELAQTNNENPEAEWRYDTSDADSSASSSSSSDSSSEDDSDDSDDEGLLNPEEQIKILMAGMDEDGDDGGGKKGRRGEEEKPEPIIPKPDLVVTEDMAIVELGEVESAIGRHILIKANTTGTYRVLDQGSPLCLADRTVIGAINDLIGKVVQPYYVVGFETPEELSNSTIVAGTTIYYVPDHAEFALVQPLMEQKHYDTNAVDEKVGEEDVEFSDDEKEAAYKASLKAKKRERYDDNTNSRGNRPGQRPRLSGIARTSLQATAYPTQIKYDEDDDGEDLYVPLSRPDNLHDMMASGIPPPTEGRHNMNNRGGRPMYSRDRDGNHNGDYRFNSRGRGRGNDRRGGRGRGGNRGGGFDNFRRDSEDCGNPNYDNSGRGNSGNYNNGDLPFRPTSRGSPQSGQHPFTPPPIPNFQQSPFQQPGFYSAPQQSTQSWNTPAHNGMPVQNSSFNGPSNFSVQGMTNGYAGTPYLFNGLNGQMPQIPVPPAGGMPNMSNPGDSLVAAFQQQFNQFRATFAQQFGNPPPASAVSPPQQLNGYPAPPMHQPASRDPRLQAAQGTTAVTTGAAAATATAQAPTANSSAALEELLRSINSGGQK